MAKKRSDLDQFPKNAAPVPAGTLMIIGGKENKGEAPSMRVPDKKFIRMEVLKDFVALISKKDPTLEIITTASRENHSLFREYESIFKELGINKIGHLFHRSLFGTKLKGAYFRKM